MRVRFRMDCERKKNRCPNSGAWVMNLVRAGGRYDTLLHPSEQDRQSNAMEWVAGQTSLQDIVLPSETNIVCIDSTEPETALVEGARIAEGIGGAGRDRTGA
jgi:hypothetical protein